MEDNEENLYMIQNLKELVEPHIVCEKSKILNVRYSRVKNIEDKYGLTWLKLDINVINISTGEECSVSLIAKTYPKNMEDKDFLHIHKLFQKEFGIYMSAKPSLELFLRQKGIKNGADFFPTPFGGRINMNGSDSVDHNAVITLQNYDILGFTKVPRRTGFDLVTSKLILKALAKFHGTILGYKDHNPDQFNEKVKPYLSNSYIPDNIARITRKHMIQVLREKEFPLEVIERAAATFDRKNIKDVKEPWATFTHNNTSVNNILIRFEKRTGPPQYVKFMDFSRSEYNSPLTDVLYFLFSSVELGILKTNLDDLIDCYYYSLNSILKRVDAKQTNLFCRLGFNRELNMTASHSEFYRTLCNLYDILGTSINCDNWGNDIPILQDVLHKRRLCYIVNEFDSRGWLHI